MHKAIAAAVAGAAKKHGVEITAKTKTKVKAKPMKGAPGIGGKR